MTVTHDTPFVEDIVPQPDDSVKKKNSLSEKYSDEAYLSAVESGDMETAQSDEYKKGATRSSLLMNLSYFSISKSVASSMTVTPSSLALVSLEPAASPATT